LANPRKEHFAQARAISAKRAEPECGVVAAMRLDLMAALGTRQLVTPARSAGQITARPFHRRARTESRYFRPAQSAESWGMSAPIQKITFAEMRAAGVRGVLVYCSDYGCSHCTRLAADRWPDDVRLSDIEPRFVCAACGRRGADVRPDWDSLGP